MTKTEAMQNALGTMLVAEIDENVNHFMFSGNSTCYELDLFTGDDREVAERVLKKYRHGFVDGTSMEIRDLDTFFCIIIEWAWR